jgi:hypothetical protein
MRARTPSPTRLQQGGKVGRVESSDHSHIVAISRAATT